MMTLQMFVGLLLLLIAASYEMAGLHLQRSLAATATRLRNPEVRNQWINQDQPRCFAYLAAIHLLSGAIALCGFVILIKQF